MTNQYSHKEEVEIFLQNRFHEENWTFLSTNGSGNEKYIAESNGTKYFVKLDVKIDRYEILSELGISPKIVNHGCLNDGTSVIVQEYISGHNPSPKDFQSHIYDVATILSNVHNNRKLQTVLKKDEINTCQEAALKAFYGIVERWEYNKKELVAYNGYIDDSLMQIKSNIRQIEGKNLASVHNDICNANWVISDNGFIFLVDLESMLIEDPSVDIGALLWWYYPYDMREQFCEIIKVDYNNELKNRMQLRMAMHCLNIMLPRLNSFDVLDLEWFAMFFDDFKAIMEGKDNPKGYYRT